MGISIPELFQNPELEHFEKFKDFDFSHEATFFQILDEGFLDFTEAMLNNSNENADLIYYEHNLHATEIYMECALLLARAPASCVDKFIEHEYPNILIQSINKFLNDSKLVIIALELCSSTSEEFCNYMVANEDFPNIIETALKSTNAEIIKCSYSLLCSLLRIPHEIEETEAILEMIYENKDNATKIEGKQLIQSEYIIKALFYVSRHSFIVIKSNDSYYDLKWALSIYGYNFVEKFTKLIVNLINIDGLDIIDKLGERNVINYLIGNTKASRYPKGLNAIIELVGKLLSCHQGYIINFREAKFVQILYQKMKDLENIRISACRGIAMMAYFDTRETMETLLTINGALCNVVEVMHLIDSESSGLLISAFSQLIHNCAEEYEEFDFIEPLTDFLENIENESEIFDQAQELLSILSPSD